MERLQSMRSKSDVIHQGITTAARETAGTLTRAEARRASEEGAGPSRKARKKPCSRHNPLEEKEDEEQHQQHPMTPPRQPGPPDLVLEEGWIHTMLTDMQRTLNELVSMVSVMNTQSYKRGKEPIILNCVWRASKKHACKE